MKLLVFFKMMKFGHLYLFVNFPKVALWPVVKSPLFPHEEGITNYQGKVNSLACARAFWLLSGVGIKKAGGDPLVRATFDQRVTSGGFGFGSGNAIERRCRAVRRRTRPRGVFSDRAIM
jgi:hypothetical protein